MQFYNMEMKHLSDMAEMYVDSFNAPPWNDKWTIQLASKRLTQMINCQDFEGIVLYIDNKICGMILGCEEQFYDGIVFFIKEFCVRNILRGQGLGTQILVEFEKHLKKKNVDEIVLFTSREDNTEKFYLNHGLSSYDKMVMMGKKL